MPMLSGHELRTRFLKFFEHEKRHHTVRRSDSLIPSGDPTVLFTSAGMNQFKDYFLGKRTDLTRAASCQKCLRTGDLERVGKSASHHSFFEMLGNFSFGDYFKRDAIQWGWEFLTGTKDFAGTIKSDTPELCVGLPGSKLWVSVYEEDEEAATLWKALGVPAERIFRFGQADNFWPANAPKDGPNGPCGPCSEIYYDADGTVQGPKSVEVWNLVFTQFDRQPDGSLKKLPKGNIDTGMGLERLTRVVQGVETDYDTDLFAPLMSKLLQHFNPGDLKEAQHRNVRMIADHARAVTLLLAEQLHPSNEGRGYVLRMLIRRCHWQWKRLLSKSSIEPVRSYGQLLSLQFLTDSIVVNYGEVYPELRKQHRFINATLRLEQERFEETLGSSESRLEDLLAQLKARGQQIVPGEEAFKLYDTYGFPLELTVDIAQEQGLTVDRPGFETALKRQQKRSRVGSQFGGDVFVTEALPVRQAIASLPPKEAQFIGYDSLTAEGIIKGLWDGKAWVASAAEGQTVGVVLDQSPFYGESGGQIGDAGRIEGPRSLADVSQTTWADEVLVHHATIRQGTMSVNDPVRAHVDPERRLKVARSHTAAHLLHWALRKVLGPEAVQAGSFVEVERVRFDFSSLHGLHEEQRHDVETLVNRRVGLADAIHASQMKLDEARQLGALALFGEKYGQTVRVVTIGDYSKELCGGTHLPHTGFVGMFTIVGESSIAAGTRRIEALVGDAATARQQTEAAWLKQIATQLGRAPEDVVGGVEELVRQVKAAEKQLKVMKEELARVEAKRFVAEAKQLDGVTFVSAHLKGADREWLATLADAIKGHVSPGIVLLASEEQPASVAWVMAMTADVVKRRLHAGELLKAIAALTQGGGGGRPDFAQAGGKDPSKIPEALRHAEQLIRQALAR